MLRLCLEEYGVTVPARLDPATAAQLAASQLVTLTPFGEADLWGVRARGKVGVARLGDIELHIRPKIDVNHLFFLLGYARDPQLWRPEDVAGAEHTDLVPAVAEAFVHQAERALRPGLLQGYRTTETSSTVLRGRIRETAQLTRRFCMPTPLEIRYDEFTPDIPENQLLLAAARRLLTLPILQDPTRRRLLRIAARLTDITTPPRGHGLPVWRANRLNDRYRAALHLADIVLRDNAVDSLPAQVKIRGFMVDMWRVFEDFITTALRAALTARGQHSQPQDPHYLDTAHNILLKPDLVHYSPDGIPRSVLDIKYKAESADGFPNSDIYQMLAYCIALGLPDGHLVYAQGNATSHNHTVYRADTQIIQHTLDLQAPAHRLLEQIAALAESLTEPHHLRTQTPPRNRSQPHLRSPAAAAQTAALSHSRQ